MRTDNYKYSSFKNGPWCCGCSAVHLAKCGRQGGIKYFTSWQCAVFINYFAPDSTNGGALNDHQLTVNATKYCVYLKKSL